jgi:aryl-alcohol dehydrogenase-like predicted oxidoreductase
MEYKNLGASGVKVSRLCLGAMTFGEASPGMMMHNAGCDEPTSHLLLNRSLEAGINFIDTADVYGQDGLSERVIGNWLVADKRREEIVLATKFRMTMAKRPNGAGASRYRIVQAVEESLQRLKTDRIDLYQVHMQDTETPVEETLRALDDLIRTGKVLYIGASNYAGYRLMESLWTADKHHTERYVALQIQYNLLIRDIEREHVPICKQFGIGILPWSPLASGLLTGKYSKDGSAPQGARLTERPAWMAMYQQRPATWDIINTCVAIAEQVQATPAQVALAWLLTKPYVTSVIFGARSVKQLDDNLAAAELKLPDAMVKQLDDVSKLDLGQPYDMIQGMQGTY